MKNSDFDDTEDYTDLVNKAGSGKESLQIPWEERLLNAPDRLKYIQNRLVELEESPHRDEILTKFANVMREVAEGSNVSKQEEFQKVAKALMDSGEFDSQGIANEYYVGLWDKRFRADPVNTLAQFEAGNYDDVRFRSSLLRDFSSMLRDWPSDNPTKARVETLKEELRQQLEQNPDLLKNTDPLQINRYIQEIARGDEQTKTNAIEKLMERMTPEKSTLILNAVLGSALSNEEKKLVLDTLTSKDPKSILLDHIVSRMSEMNTIPEHQSNNKLRELTSTVEEGYKLNNRPVVGTTPLTLLMVLANDKGMCTVRDAGAEPIDGLEQALAVQNYATLEQDPAKREQFATKQLNKYVESLDVTNLNDKEKEKISKAFIAIMEPICSPKEKSGLKNSVDKLVRECAQHAGEKKSFKQAWHDNIVEPIKRLLGRENVLKSFDKGSTNIKESINKKTTSFAEKATADKIAASGKQAER